MPQSITSRQLHQLLLVKKNDNEDEDENQFDPNVIKGSEIEEYFEISKMDMMNKIYYRMLDNCNLNCDGIMRNPKHSAMSDFFELLKNNIDTRSYYTQKFKLHIN